MTDAERPPTREEDWRLINELERKVTRLEQERDKALDDANYWRQQYTTEAEIDYANRAERDALQAERDELREQRDGLRDGAQDARSAVRDARDQRDALQARVEELSAALERIRGEDYPAQVADLNEMLKDTEQERDGLREALSWALDLLDLYDEHLIELGDPREKVYSPVHVAGKAKARSALSQPNTSTTEEKDG